MEVTWVGGSSFRLRGRDTTVVTDPHTGGSGQPSATLEADVVTVSENTSGKLPRLVSCRDDRVGDAFVACGPGEYEIAGVYVHGVPAPAASGQDVTLYTIDIDRLSVGHIPEFTSAPGDDLLDAIGAIHILLIGVGAGSESLPASEVIKTINRIEPNVVVPYAPDGDAESSGAWHVVASELCAVVPTPSGNLTANRRQLPEPINVQVLQKRN